MKVKSESKVAQSCPTFSDPVDRSLPGSSVHGIFQAGVLEWGAIAFSLKVIKKYWVQSLCYTIRLCCLFSTVMCICSYQTPNSSLPISYFFVNHPFVFYAYKSVSVFYISTSVSFFFFPQIPHTNSIIWYLSFSGLLPLALYFYCMSIRVAANGIISLWCST